MSKTAARAMLRQGIRARFAVRLGGDMATNRLPDPIRWLLFKENAVGVGVAALVLLLMGGLLVGLPLLLRPVGPASEAIGTVVGVGSVASEYGFYLTASVQLPDGNVVRVNLPSNSVCRAGDLVVVVRRPTALGAHHKIKRRGCA